MEILSKNIPISELETNDGQVAGLPANPREIQEERFEALKKSIIDAPSMLSMRELLVYPYNGKYVIVGGNMRFRACVVIGYEELPCKIIPADFTPTQLREITIKDNENFGRNDWEKLAAEWNFEELKDWGMAMPEDWENAEAIENGEDVTQVEAEEDDFDEESDDIPKRCESGDLWQCGEHRLICGDSTVVETLQKLMQGDKADMVFTDPPYGMNLDTDYSSMQGIAGGNKYAAGHVDEFRPEMVQAAINLGAAETFLFGADYFAELLPNKNGGSWIVWDKRANDGGTIEQDASSDKMFGSCFELCWSKAKHKREIARIKWAGLFGLQGEFDHKRCHPTQKPIALVAWFLNRFGKEGDIVADIFGGSGSTLIACEQLNRKARLVELDPHYCDVIIARWESFTNQKAVRL